MKSLIITLSFIIVSIINYNITYSQVPGPDPVSDIFWVDNTNTGGSGTIGDPYEDIQNALDDPKCNDGDMIIVNVGTGVYTGPRNTNITFNNLDVTLRSENNDPQEITIDCEGNSRAFNYINGSNGTLKGFTIINGYAYNGGAISCTNNSNPTIDRCWIGTNSQDYNIASNNGGGIYCDSSNPTIKSCTIKYNQTEAGFGGGICSIDSSIVIRDSSYISDNTSSTNGGGIYCSGNTSSPQFLSSYIRDNFAFGDGGGIYCNICHPIISSCEINGNRVEPQSFPGSGGGIYCYYSHPTITNGSISGNVAKTHGGGIACFHSYPSITGVDIEWNQNFYGNGGGVWCYEFVSDTNSTTITDCFIYRNTSSTNGGGVYVWDSNPKIKNCQITLNTANSAGGGVSCELSHITIIETSHILGNKAYYGGGIYCYESYRAGSPLIMKTHIESNTAVSKGGGIYCEAGSVHHTNPYITNCWIKGNNASEPMSIPGLGGGIYIGSDTTKWCYPDFINCLIVNNRASGSGNSNGGGLYYQSKATGTIINCTISQNTASNAQGAGGLYGNNLNISIPLKIDNCIFWNDTPVEIIETTQNTINVNTSDIQGGWGGLGSGNIFAPPLFVNPSQFDFHLQMTPILSPCINMGNWSVVPQDIFDLDGNQNTTEKTPDLDLLPRVVPIQPPLIDMGCYENPSG